MRSALIREALFLAIRLTGLPWLVRTTLQRRRATLVLYHDIEPERLDAHLTALGRRYAFISLDHLREAIARGSFDDLPGRAMVVTLDDGYAGNRALLDVFRKHGVRPTIFLCSAIVGTRRRVWCGDPPPGADVERLKRLADADRVRALAELGFDELAEGETPRMLTQAEVKEMHPWVDFQSHTRLHPMLPRCDDARAEREIAASRTELRDSFGVDATVLSYPNGDYSDRDIALARAAGYTCGITVDLGLNGPDADLFRLKRICLSDRAGVNETLVKATGIPASVRNLLRGQPYGYAPAETVGRAAPEAA